MTTKPVSEMTAQEILSARLGWPAHLTVDEMRKQLAHEEQQREEDRKRHEANEAALTIEAERMADRFDIGGLTYQINRWSFGSLSHQWNAAHYRKVYWRAFQIKSAREQPVMQAAE